MTRPTRAAVYVRVSTDEQAERGTSLPDQLSRTEAFCVERGWNVVHRYRDEGISGATIERPELQSMLVAARAGAFDRLVVTDPDRLSRDLVDGLVIERELAAAGVEVVYLIQPAMGTLERQLRGVIAEEERRKIRERTSRGLRAVAAAGYWPGGPPPYGYRIELDESTGHRRLEIERDEADTLIWIIGALVDEGMSSWDVANELNLRGVPTAATSRRPSTEVISRWTHRKVRNLLEGARAISGEWVYQTNSGAITLRVPPIVTPERHDQLRRRLRTTSTGPGATSKKNVYLLAGRIRSECGAPMHGTAKPGGANRIYRCSMSTPDRGTDRCDCRRVSADAVEHAVWLTVREMLSQPARMVQLAGLVAATNSPDGQDDVRAIDRKIRRLEEALGTQIAGLLEQGLDSAAVGAAAQQLETDLARLREHRARVAEWSSVRASTRERAGRLERLAQSARATLVDPSPEQQINTLAILDIRVRVVGHQPCVECGGRGLVAAPKTSGSTRRGRTGAVCPVCRRYRTIPLVTVEGLLPDIDSIESHAQSSTLAPGAPFRIEPAGA